MATLAGIQVSRAVVQLPQFGIWSARVTLAQSKALALRSRVALVIGDLTLSGTIRRGGDYLGESSYLVVGGADGWASPVLRRTYRGDNGVRLSQVAKDLAADAGESLSLDAADLPLGYAWTRPEGLASVALAELAQAAGMRSWVAHDGVTHLGKARPARTLPASLPFAVQAFDPSRPSALLATPDDAITVFQPGTVLAAPGVSGFMIASTVVRVEPGGVSIEVDGLDMVEQVRAALEHRSAGSLFHGLYSYSVQEQINERLSLHAIESVDGLPDQLVIEKAHGIAGASEVCAVGSTVLVGFKGGRPSAPFVAHYLASDPPVSMAIDVQTELRLGGPGASPVAKAALVAAELTKIQATLAPIVTAFNVSPAGTPLTSLGTGAVPPYASGTVAASKVKAQ